MAQEIYCGTDPSGKLLKWNGTDAWAEVAGQLNSQNAIYSLVVLNDELYGGTSPGGRLFKYNGTDAWVEVAPLLNSQTIIWSLVVLNGKIYGGTSPWGKLFEWNGSNAWVEVAPQLNAQAEIRSLVVLNGKIYGCTYNGGRLFEWNGSNAWVQVAPRLNNLITYCIAVFNGKIYAGIYNTGLLYEWNGSNAWVQVAPQLNSQQSIDSLVVFNSKLYGGAGINLTGGRLFEWNDVNAWVEKAPTFNGQGWLYGMVVLNNKLYGCTTPNGRLFQWNGTDAWIQKAPQLGSETNLRSLIVMPVLPESPPELLPENIVGELLDYHNTSDDDSSLSIGGANIWLFQTITATVDYTLKGVRLKLFRNESPGDITVSIRDVVAGDPVGDDVILGTLNGNAITAEIDGEWYWISLGPGHGLKKGTRYAIVIRALDAIGDNYIKWREQKFGNGYPGGRKGQSDDGGVSWTPNDESDMMFETYGDLPISDIDLDIVSVEGGDVTNKIKGSVKEGVRPKSNFVQVRPYDSATGLRKE